MNRRVRLIVECEDSLHRCFLARFIRELGLPEGRNPEINLRGPKGDVLNHAPGSIRAVRNASVRAHQIVVVDGDNWPEAKVRDQIDKRLLAEAQPCLTSSDRVFVAVVGRRMDTWVRHLRGEVVDEISGENGHPGNKLQNDSEARVPATVLADHCRNHRPLTDPLPSLAAVCREWEKYRQRHGI